MSRIRAERSLSLFSNLGTEMRPDEPANMTVRLHRSNHSMLDVARSVTFNPFDDRCKDVCYRKEERSAKGRLSFIEFLSIIKDRAAPVLAEEIDMLHALPWRDSIKARTADARQPTARALIFKGGSS